MTEKVFYLVAEVIIPDTDDELQEEMVDKVTTEAFLGKLDKALMKMLRDRTRYMIYVNTNPY